MTDYNPTTTSGNLDRPAPADTNGGPAPRLFFGDDPAAQQRMRGW